MRVLVALAALFAGQVWVFQLICLLTGYLAGIPHPLDNAWKSILWLSDIARTIERFSGLFGFFVLGLVFLVGGVYDL
jgi:hypothetical protein